MKDNEEASLILQSALRDMDELISECILASENSKTKLEEQTLVSNEVLRKGQSKTSENNNILPKLQLHSGGLAMHVNVIVVRLKECLTELENIEKSSHLLVPEAQKVVKDAMNEILNFMKEKAFFRRCNLASGDGRNSGIGTGTSDFISDVCGATQEEEALRSQIIALKNQINLQALRIAELEQLQIQKPMSYNVQSPSGWDKLELEAELSRQQFQIASLECNKHRLEERLSLINKQSYPNGVQMNGDCFGLQDHEYAALPSYRDSRGVVSQPHHKSHIYLSYDATDRSNLRSSTLNRFERTPEAPQFLQTDEMRDTVSSLSRANRSITDSFRHGQAYDNVTPINSVPHKSVSLNELNYQRLNVVGSTPQSDPPLVSPHGKVFHNPTSPSPAGVHNLPPQYASDQHKLTRLPVPNTDEFQYAAAKTESPILDRQPPNLQEFTSMENSLFPWTPSFRRAKTPTETINRLSRTTSPPTVRKFEQFTTSSDDAHSRDSDSKPTGRTSRFKRIFSDNRSQRASSQRRHSMSGDPRSCASNAQHLLRTTGDSCDSRKRPNRNSLSSISGHAGDEDELKQQTTMPLRTRFQSLRCMNMFRRQSVQCSPVQHISDCGRNSTKSIPSITIDQCHDTSVIPEVLDFTIWDRDMVSAFLHDLGLGYAVPFMRRWIKQGSELVNASRKELEQYTGIRNPMHLKKLLLHIQARTKETLNALPTSVQHTATCIPSMKFDVSAWLDDVGLTMYTTVFKVASVDAFVLNNLTMDDLFAMKITNEVHFLSIRRGLQILRRINFDLTALLRATPLVVHQVNQAKTVRNHLNENNFNHQVKGTTDMMSGSISKSYNSWFPEEGNVPPQRPSCVEDNPSAVCFWTQCRVMAWLHDIELPEYAPELAGSGVHGALIVLEDRFSADLLANILRIPVSKTLVRRHLSSKFAELVGEDVWKRKMAVLKNSDIPILTVSSKIKPTRKYGLFMHWKHKNLMDTELVCPLDIDAEHAGLLAKYPSMSEREQLSSESIPPLEFRETEL